MAHKKHPKLKMSELCVIVTVNRTCVRGRHELFANLQDFRMPSNTSGMKLIIKQYESGFCSGKKHRTAVAKHNKVSVQHLFC